MAARTFDTIEVVDATPPYGGDLLESLGLRGLNCGCGHELEPGWLNTDIQQMTTKDGGVSSEDRIVLIDGSSHYLQHDARKPYPLGDATIKWVHSEHFIEHIKLGEAMAWLHEMRRVVKPGGLLRITTPDLRKYIEGYLDPEGKFFAEHRRTLSKIGAYRGRKVPDRRAFMVNQTFIAGHEWMYDFEEMRFAARRAGFDPEAVVECSYGVGRDPELCALDRAWRDNESLYVEIART